MSTIFDLDDVAIVTKDGLHKNTPVLIKKLCHTYRTPYNTDIFYDCETTDSPPKIIVVNEKDLISFDDYLEDMDFFDMSEEDIEEAFHFLPELALDDILERETEIVKSCECGSEKAGLPTHSHWCPKHG